MRSSGGTMEEVKVVEKILRSLTPKFDYVICSIKESKNVAEMRIDELQSFLLVHEQRLSRTNTKEEEVVEEVDEVEEEVVKAIKLVEGLGIEMIANHLMSPRKMMTLKEREDATMTSPSLSVTDVETLVSKRVSVI
ncbi:hypothetical protein L3X38_037098 [Prunus dulcis]|uniref:Uncharacterized protein n=1 Tax=Prunus dulcis TaxID=3755 RepID=A0AAD4YQ31_PRUDU|nr:hypothetical protein L3X38_037098 [Prunus dulcis]